MALAVAKVELFSEDEKRKLKKVLNKTKVAPIKKIGTNFLEGVNDIDIMVELPRVIISHSIAYSEVLVEGLQVCSEYWQDADPKDLNIDNIDNVLEELRNRLANVPQIKDRKVEERLNQLVTGYGYMWTNLELERILKLHEQLAKSYFSLIHSSIVWMWTLFEVATADLWETALNVGFDTLGRDALKRMAKNDRSAAFEDKMRGKYIRLDYLAEFDYNIREHAGSILKHYFDFSSLTGITNAYKFAFPRSTTVQKSLSSHELKLLAEQRNLIVHKAGYIDKRYKRLAQTKASVGDKLRVDKRHTEIYTAAIIKAFKDLLNCANKYLSLDYKPSK
jgi:hypothetical protein